MTAVLIAAVEAVVAGASLGGWGRMIRGRREVSPPLTIALGLGGVLFVGGLLNLFHLATPAGLNAVILLGLLAVLPPAIRAIAAGRKGSSWQGSQVPPLLLLLVVGGFVALHLAPQKSFNIYDDFEKYFAHPARMLASGTLGGNRLSSIGGETLGGQAFLQGFVLAHLPPAYLGTVDTCLGLLLCMALAGFAVTPSRSVVVALVAELAVIVLNPAIINISAVFTGAALVMAVVFLPGVSTDSAGKPAPSAWLGLLYAGMIALKTTFLLFVVLHLLALALTRAAAPASRRAWWRLALGSLAWTGFFLSPWLLLSAPVYWAGLHAATLHPATIGGESFAIFSMGPELYGGTQTYYTAVAGGAVLAALGGLVAGRFGRVERSPAWVAATAGALTAGVAYFVLVLWLAPAAFGREGATRYAGPFFIGAIPAAIRLGGTWPGRSGLARVFPIALLAAVVALFAPSTVARIRQIAAYDTPLAFSPSITAPAFIAYNQSVLWGSARERLAAVQHLVPARERILAWVTNPFLLDFRRNPITEANLAGLGSRWAWPPKSDYFLWEYRGYAVKYPGFVMWSPADYTKIFYGECLMDRINSVRALSFVVYLEDNAKRADLLYNDGSLALFRARR